MNSKIKLLVSGIFVVLAILIISYLSFLAYYQEKAYSELMNSYKSLHEELLVEQKKHEIKEYKKLLVEYNRLAESSLVLRAKLNKQYDLVIEHIQECEKVQDGSCCVAKTFIPDGLFVPDDY